MVERDSRHPANRPERSEIGPMPAPVVIVDYDAGWPLRFEAARSGIMEAVGSLVVSIEHIGSTAVPNLPAKPIIDIMPGIQRFEDGEACVPPLKRLGTNIEANMESREGTILSKMMPREVVRCSSTWWYTTPSSGRAKSCFGTA